MRALCWHGKNKVQVDTVPDPQIQEPTDAIIKIFGVIAFIVFMIVAAAYINPAFRIILMTWTKWAVVLAAMATALWWWRSSTMKAAQLSSERGGSEPSHIRKSLRQPPIQPHEPPLSPLDQTGLAGESGRPLAQLARAPLTSNASKQLLDISIS